MEILADFLIRKDKAYYCPYGDFYIDPLYPVSTAVVSHAHGDHASPGHREVYSTEFTAQFMCYRFPKPKTTIYRSQAYDQSFRINEVDITFIPAGHILGSAQILMQYKGVRYLYTGDYKLQEDITCEPIEIVESDVLITETTFANPDVIHPDPVSEILKLNAVDVNIMLGCYTLGKAQRITSLINAHCPDKVVLVHHKMAPVHRLYETIGGVRLNYKLYNRKDMKEGLQNKVYLVPPLTFNSYYRATNVKRVFASGWERLQLHNDLSLYISDHVDWNDLLTFIEKVKPQEIWTVHGDGTKLKSYLQGQIVVRDILT